MFAISRAPRARTAAIVGLLVVVLFILDAYAMYHTFTSRQVGANDFYPRWRGAQLFWQENIDPYSEEATLAIQQGIRNRPSQPDEDQLAFAYPFYTVFLLRPLIHLPYPWVQAIWMVLIQFSLVGGTLLYLRTIRWPLTPVTLALTGIWSLLVYHSLRTILLGQFAGIVYLAIAGTLWALSRKEDLLAGSFLVLATLKPQMTVFLIPALLLWAVGQRRWRFTATFLMVSSVLLVLSWIAHPGWVAGFVGQILRYPSYTDYGNPVWIVTQLYLPQLGRPVEIGVTLLFVFYMLWQWRRVPSLDANSAAFHWTIGVTLIVTNFVVPRTATTNYVMMYLPLFLALYAFLHSRPVGERVAWLSLFYTVSFGGLWLLFLTTVRGDYEAPVVFLPAPTLLFLVALFARSRIEQAPTAIWR